MPLLPLVVVGPGLGTPLSSIGAMHGVSTVIYYRFSSSKSQNLDMGSSTWATRLQAAPETVLFDISEGYVNLLESYIGQTFYRAIPQRSSALRRRDGYFEPHIIVALLVNGLSAPRVFPCDSRRI